MKNLVVVRGGGDIATGTIYKLVKSGFRVLVLEIDSPSAIRRNVAFSEAVYEGKWRVEDMTCYRAENLKEAYRIMDCGNPALLVDPHGKCIEEIKPMAVIDGILAKRNLGTSREMAPVTIGLGPGFTAGKDVDAVIETMRGHKLGRVIYKGSAIPNTGIPGNIAGVSKERVIHSPAEGILRNIHHITDMVEKGESIAWIETKNGNVQVPATIDGLLRGLIRDGYPVAKGFKIADIDPRAEEYDNCFTISDKARCIAGGVLEALLSLQMEKCTHLDQSSQVYADCAATSIHKPLQVKEAMERAMEYGNAGRGVHESALKSARSIYKAREILCDFFDADSPEQVVFTSGVTESLNIAIKGLINPEDQVITTWMEHNSVLRPLYEMEQKGTEITITNPVLEDIKKAVGEKTKALVMTHGSNVTGEVFDIENIGKFCREKGILFIVDCAQTAGIFPVSMKKDFIDVLCFTGHKGLLGPQGIGGMCVRTGLNIRPLITGGSGVQSFSKTHPVQMPTALEAGTLNGPGIAGITAGIEYIYENGMDIIRQKEQKNIRQFYEMIKDEEKIQIYGTDNLTDFKKRTAILSCNIKGIDSSAVSDELMQRFKIETRSGAHCAPLVHKYFHTEEQGMVRFSFGHDTTSNQIRYAADMLKLLARE
ncbi:molybdenum hydroxylase [Anaerostipes sp. 494a]|uniref:selenium-dependent molybdenum cofactor biosynthesis protein YqeB n=1 Tax=Anaerostipes sp. 494a TaxID=1261636 RepID=UPI0009511192|nr:selenium-dependent molybdenum cofactor biosynthesis protein YqeB [Anaerostipes sp. 494a]OLR58486.1 molybdenum hydroxylase [Anaerostipes sp. 494a]